jgi:hypothetical protein
MDIVPARADVRAGMSQWLDLKSAVACFES